MKGRTQQMVLSQFSDLRSCDNREVVQGTFSKSTPYQRFSFVLSKLGQNKLKQLFKDKETTIPQKRSF